MPECTALGVKSSSSVASSFGRSPPDAPPQPAQARRTRRASPRRSRTTGIVATDAPARHLLAKPDALALADMPLLLQVLRVRHAPPAPPRARGGRADPRRRPPPPCEGAARAHGGGARPPSRRQTAAAGARLRGLHRLRRVGVRARAGARPAAAHEPRRALRARPRPPT